MATVQKQFFRGQSFISQNTIYTVPSEKQAIVTSIIVSNTSQDDQTFSIWLDGYEIAADTVIFTKSILSLDIRQVLGTGQEIAIKASSPDVKMHISGVEIS